MIEILKRHVLNDQRSLKQYKTIFFSFLFKGSGVLCSLLIIPISLRYLGNASEYGLWLTISSIVSWIAFFDGGLGNGLKNKLSESFAKNDLDKAKTLVSTAYFGITFIAICAIMLFCAANNLINWAFILKVPLTLKYKINGIILVVFISFFLKLVLDLVNSVLSASQNLEYVSFINFVINIFQLTGIVAFTFFVKNEQFATMAIYYSVVPLVIMVFFNFILFKSKFNKIAPTFRRFKKDEFKHLFTLGSKFFVIQIAVIIVFATDNVLILRIFNPNQVTIYNVCYKYFSILSFGWNIIISPYWVAFNEAYVKKDYMWIKKTIHNLEKMLLGLLLLVVIFIVAASFVFKIWVNIQIPMILTIYMGLFVLVSSFTNIYVYLLNGLGKVNVQLYVCIVAAIINIPLCLLFTQYYHWGVEGIIFSSVLTILPSLVLGRIQYQKIINNLRFGAGVSSIWDN